MSGEREETTIDGKSVNSDLIWTDNPELEYFRSMVTNREDGRIETEDSLIGDSTIREMFEVAGNSRALQTGARDTSGLSDTESNTVDNIYLEDGSLLNKKPTQNSAFDDGTIETPEDENLVPKTMAHVRQNIDQNHQPNIEYATQKNNFHYVEPKCVFAPAEQIEPHRVDLGEANTVSKESVSIPGFIFVTDGHPSIVQTKKKDPKSDQTTEKRSRSMCVPRTLLICMTLIVLVASTVIAVLVYKMNTDTSDLTSASSQSQIDGSQTIVPKPQPTSAPTGLRGSNGSQTPTPNDDSDVAPSMAPSVSIPNSVGTSPPTKSPTISPVNTPVPTLSFTDLPTIAPTNSPTNSPTITPTNSPTNSPTSSPTIRPTEAGSVELTTGETCIPTIETDVSCYETGDDIEISFNICDPASTEWVGVYPASQGTSNLGNPLAWFKTCDDEQCVGAEENAGVGTIFNVSRRGRYRAYLIRQDENSVLGFSAFASTDRFAILGNCN